MDRFRRRRTRIGLRRRPLGDRLRQAFEILARYAVLAQVGRAGERAQLARALDRVAVVHRLAEPRDPDRRHLTVVAKRRRQADRVHRPVREPVTAAKRLRHRVPEAHPGTQRRAGVHRALEQLPAGLEVATGLDHDRQPVRDQLRAGKRLPVALLGAARRVQRLGAVRERVHRRARALGLREVERQLRGIDDRHRARAPAAPLDPGLGVTHPEALRPLRARVGGRDRDDLKAALARHRLGRVDRTAATERDDPVRAGARLDRGSDAADLRVRPGAIEPPRHRELDLPPPLGADQQRIANRQLLEHAGQRLEAPAHDQRPLSLIASAIKSQVRLRPRAPPAHPARRPARHDIRRRRAQPCHVAHAPHARHVKARGRCAKWQVMHARSPRGPASSGGGREPAQHDNRLERDVPCRVRRDSRARLGKASAVRTDCRTVHLGPPPAASMGPGTPSGQKPWTLDRAVSEAAAPGPRPSRPISHARPHGRKRAGPRTGGRPTRLPATAASRRASGRSPSPCAGRTSAPRDGAGSGTAPRRSPRGPRRRRPRARAPPRRP